MKKLLVLLIYSFALLIIGRNLSVLPYFSVIGNQTLFSSVDASGMKKATLAYINLHHSVGSFSVYYKNLTTGQSFGVNEHKVLTAASMNKIFIVGYLFHLAEEKKIDLEEKIVIQQSDIQNYGTGSIQYADPGQAYTLRNLAELSLEQSDNTAAHVLGVRLGLDRIQLFVSGLGLLSTDIGNDMSSAQDVGTFFTLLYQQKITSDSYTKEMLDFMKDTEFEDRIPRFLPDTVSVYHKTGDAINMIHDGGIVDNGKNPFVLVVLTEGVTDESLAKKAIGKIAQTIYDLQK